MLQIPQSKGCVGINKMQSLTHTFEHLNHIADIILVYGEEFMKNYFIKTL